MCKHPVWGQACQKYRDQALSGQHDYRIQEQLKRESSPQHSMCPESAEEPVIVQFHDFCYWRHVIPLFANTEGCPVKCQVLDQNEPHPNSHVFLDQCSTNGRPPTQSIWGSITLEWQTDDTLSLKHMQAHDLQVNWVREVSDVYVNYMYAWNHECGQPKDYATSPCRRAPPTKQELTQKSFGAMYISKCTGYRIEYARELNKWLLELSNGTKFITSYGACDHTPGTSGSGGAEAKVVQLKQVKFHLSFENSIRPDYFTEKLQQSMVADTLAVVWAAPHAEDFTPGGARSFINALEFDSPQSLAKKMLELDQDDDEYLKYFAWRNKTELNPQFVAQSRYNLENTGEYGFACRTCLHYLRRFCNRDV